ncbi:MAG: pyridoxal phosphate-dependent aminotransferase [Bifidobacterium sp.]|nr:pyridoxal phosphate-dependent aminotransferase [Bifidobacterium sp.]MCI1864588.1 pyridoxal phosphate-dependent aminotransferase [Bifidobacterium sp.]
MGWTSLGDVRFSSRVDLESLNPIAMREREMRSRGDAVRSLNDSNPTRYGLAPSSLPGEYRAEPRGPMPMRRGLAAWLNRRAESESMAGASDGPAHVVDPGNLYVLSSTSQAYSWLMKLLCDPGDAVLAPRPGYPLVESIARLECARTLNYQLRFDGSWYVDIPSLRSLFDDDPDGRIRAMVVINPNNPSGSYIRPGERDRIVEMCRRHGVALIADEVFYDYALEPEPTNRRFAGESGVLTFALDGFSKSLAAPNAKVGWIEVSGPADDVAEAERRLDLIADDYLPMSDIIMRHLPAMLAEGHRQTLRVGGRVRGNLRTLHSILDGDPDTVVSVLRAEGGWNVLLRVPSTIDENSLVLHLIETRRLTAQPGYFFDMPSDGYLAVSLLPEPDTFARNIHAVLDAVAEMLRSDAEPC